MGNRIWAAFIDMCLLYLGIIVLVLIAALVVLFLSQAPIEDAIKTSSYYYIVGAALLLIFALQFGYFIAFEKLWQGQTPGKKIANIRVIESNGQPVTWSSVIIRNLMRIVDTGLMMIGVVSMILDKNERRLGDFLGGTLVIRERQPELSTRLLRIEATEPASSFCDAGQISPDEYHLLVAFLRRRGQMETHSRSALARQLQELFSMKLQTENQGESAEKYLEKVYLAYNARARLEAS
ncbi:MAG: RDD family protein [Candidatus Obscuribacterales bacterium]|nr:RDD family protein [Candidatus Obscuribacterales bacterium]